MLGHVSGLQTQLYIPFQAFSRFNYTWEREETIAFAGYSSRQSI